MVNILWTIAAAALCVRGSVNSNESSPPAAYALILLPIKPAPVREEEVEDTNPLYLAAIKGSEGETESRPTSSRDGAGGAKTITFTHDDIYSWLALMQPQPSKQDSHLDSKGAKNGDSKKISGEKADISDFSFGKEGKQTGSRGKENKEMTFEENSGKNSRVHSKKGKKGQHDGHSDEEKGGKFKQHRVGKKGRQKKARKIQRFK